MTLSHAYKNISQYRRRYGIDKWIRAIIHYGFVVLKKPQLKSSKNIVEANGYKIKVIPGDLGTSLELLLFKTHEPITTKIVSKIVKKGMTCLDIGSNIGYYVLLENKIIGNKGKVIAIEPSPKNFEYLKKNIEIQRTKNIQAFNFAAGDKTGYINFLNYKNESNSGRVIPDNEVINWPGQVVKLPVKTIDSFLEEIEEDKIDFLRMDVEGYEYQIFQGMKNTIRRSKPIIQIEVHKSIMGTETTKKWLIELKDEGYELKSYVPREIDNPIIGSMNDVKNYTICELIELLEDGKLPSFFMLQLQNNLK